MVFSLLICTFVIEMATRRIEYIDAMRGFTMILVVFAHICHFCLGDSRMGYNAVFILFRLPCFFMLSGWLFEPIAQRSFMAIARHKFMVQIVPTFIFLLLLAPPPLFFEKLGALKGGYWFTFVLFEFFVIYMFSVRLGKKWQPWVALAVTVISSYYTSCYNGFQSSAVGCQVWLVNLLGFLSVTLWRFYLFFYIGTLMRKHFDTFIRWTNKPIVILLITIIFFIDASTPHYINPLFEMSRFYVGGITGMWMIFTCFRLFDSWLKKLYLSKPLQYVGTRTLDVYLLHYFFLPRFLMSYADLLKTFDSQFVEFLVIMGISLIVLLLSLLTSYILRLSPFLGHYLFGVKYEH